MDRDQTRKLTSGGRTARITLLAISALIAVLAIPASASATRGLTTGFEDGDEFQGADQAVRTKWFDRATDAGAGIVRLAVIWPAIAATGRPADPTNPGSTSYDFSSVDAAVRDAESRGLKVLLSVNGAPDYAEAPGRPSSVVSYSWKPNPSDVADFMQAVASRYSGSFDPDNAGPESQLPAAQAVEVWNEANSSDWLTPQYEGKTATGPELYRAMLNASYKSVKSVNPQMLVLAGGTEPYGDPPGGKRIQPVLFWQQLLCVHPTKSKKKGKAKKGAPPKYARTNGCTAPRFDVLSHHPIDNTGSGPLHSGPRPGDASTPDLGRIVNVLRGAEKAGTVSSGRHPVWVTEFWWDSKPPNPVGAKLQLQARWIEQSLYLFWKAGAATAVNFQIADASTRPNVHAGYQAGVYFQDGRPKPSLQAFEFPFVTNRTTRTKLEAWGKAPESGKLLIQRQQGSRWLTVKKLQVSKGGVFDTSLRLSGKQSLRASVGSSKSLVWKQAAAATKGNGGGGSSLPSLPVLFGIGAVALLTAGFARRRQVVRRRRQRRPRAAPAGTA
jgi:hypothetical protein